LLEIGLDRIDVLIQLCIKNGILRDIFYECFSQLPQNFFGNVFKEMESFVNGSPKEEFSVQFIKPFNVAFLLVVPQCLTDVLGKGVGEGSVVVISTQM